MAFKNIGTSSETVRVQGSIYIPSSNSHIDSVAIFIDNGGSSTQVGSTIVPTADQWVDFDVTGQVSGAKIHFRAKDGGTFTITDSAGDDVFYLDNVRVDATQSNAAVHTWYDQSGNSNDATQDTADNQPLIAENGSLVVDGNGNPTISFDVNLANLKVDSFTGGSIAQPYSFFIVAKSKNADANEKIVFSTPSNFIGQSQSSTGRYQIRGGSTSLDGTNVPNTTDQRLFSAFFDSTDELFIDGSASSEISGDGGSSAISDLSIGSQYYLGNPNNDFNGDISEVILYPSSEKSNNRFKIESNINNHYTIYTAAQNGFVNTMVRPIR